jgi:hypothetical protein
METALTNASQQGSLMPRSLSLAIRSMLVLGAACTLFGLVFNQ